MGGYDYVHNWNQSRKSFSTALYFVTDSDYIFQRKKVIELKKY